MGMLNFINSIKNKWEEIEERKKQLDKIIEDGKEFEKKSKYIKDLNKKLKSNNEEIKNIINKIKNEK